MYNTVYIIYSVYVCIYSVYIIYSVYVCRVCGSIACNTQGCDVYYFRSPDYQFDENYIITEPNNYNTVQAIVIAWARVHYTIYNTSTRERKWFINRIMHVSPYYNCIISR